MENCTFAPSKFVESVLSTWPSSEVNSPSTKAIPRCLTSNRALVCAGSTAHWTCARANCPIIKNDAKRLINVFIILLIFIFSISFYYKGRHADRAGHCSMLIKPNYLHFVRFYLFTNKVQHLRSI